MSDQNPGMGGAGEEVDVLELEPTTEEKTAQGGDPLDDITDVVARAEAKKNRAIARRVSRKGKDDEPAPRGDEHKASEFVTKTDLEKANERRAILAAHADPEVKANWTEIQQLYSPRHGRETAEDISEDIKDAIILFNARKGTVSTETTPDLISQPVVKNGGGENNGKAPTKVAELPGLRTPVPPKDWYSMKKEDS